MCTANLLPIPPVLTLTVHTEDIVDIEASPAEGDKPTALNVGGHKDGVEKERQRDPCESCRSCATRSRQ